jgi:DNA invertase Pin-like site-specific DNA recombinase
MIGYIRSTKDGEISSQQATLTHAGCTEFFTDKVGLREAQPELENLLKYIRSGDTIMVTELSCIARNTAALLKLVGKFEIKEATFISLDDGINTSKPGCCFFKTVKAIVKLEKNFKAKLTEVKTPVKPRGRSGGRPGPSQKTLADAALLFSRGGKTADEIAKMFKIGRRTLFNYLKAQKKIEKENERDR